MVEARVVVVCGIGVPAGVNGGGRLPMGVGVVAGVGEGVVSGIGAAVTVG